MFQLKGLKLGAKAWTAVLAIVTWFVTNPDVIHAVNGFAARHHWAVAFGAFLTLVGHMLYQPAGGKP